MIERIDRGAAMRKCRKAARMGRLELAEAAGVSDKTLWNWEHNMSVPSMDALLLVSKALGVSVDAYIGNAPIPDSAAVPVPRWVELVCFARDPDASGLVIPVVYMCSRCGRLQYEKTAVCMCGLRMDGGVDV